MSSTRLRLVALALLAGSAAAGCAEPNHDSQAVHTDHVSDAAARTNGVYSFKVGDIDAWAISDGQADFPNDGKILAINADPKAVAGVLREAGLPTDKLTLYINNLLLRSGDRLVLVDTGAGAASPIPTAGRLAANLARAGVSPASITDIIVSHSHFDHVGGLTTKDGGLAYPNARIHIAAAEWAHMKAQPNLAALARAIEPRVATFAPGASIAPGVRTVAIQGHTPGHVGVEIASRGERLLYIGDMAHHSVVSLANPDWTIVYDGDAPTAQASRRAVLQRAADERLRLFAAHFPFPGIGTVRREGEGFAWTPIGR